MLQHMQCPLSQRRNADALARTNQGQLIPRRKKGKFRLVCREPYPDPWTLPSSGAVGTRLRRRACTGKEARLSARGLRDAGQEEASPCQPQGTLLAQDVRSIARHFCDCPFFEQRQRAPSSHKDAAGCSQGGGYGSIDGVRLQGRHASFLSGSGKRSGACG